MEQWGRVGVGDTALAKLVTVPVESRANRKLMSTDETRPFHSSWLHFGQLVLGICYEKLPVSPKTFRNRNDAEDGSFCFRFVGTQNVLGAHLSQLLNRAEIIIPQPLRHFWIRRFRAGQFNDRHHGIKVPISRTPF